VRIATFGRKPKQAHRELGLPRPPLRSLALRFRFTPVGDVQRGLTASRKPTFLDDVAPLQTRLTPKLPRICSPGIVANLTIKSETLFKETLHPLNASPFFGDLIADFGAAREPDWANDREFQIGLLNQRGGGPIGI
jgi:hypothetical protein